MSGGGDALVFADATRYARERAPFPLSAGEVLKATCGVWTDDEVVAFSLRAYTARQAEREVEHVQDTVGGTVVTRSHVLRPRMPRKTLQSLREAAGELSAVLGDGIDDIVVELDGDLYVMTLARDSGHGELSLTGRLVRAGAGYTRSGAVDTDAEFKLPVEGVRLRVFLRSPVRRRVVTYAFGGYLARKPGEVESVLRATALALNSVLGLAAFRLLSGLDRVAVPPAAGGAPVRSREPAGPVPFTVPVRLLTADGAPAARGRVAGAVDLEQLDPVTGGLRIRLGEGDPFEWDPAVAGPLRFETYAGALAEAVSGMIHSALGADAMREIACDIVLGDLGDVAVAGLRTAVAGLPPLTATPARAESSPGRPPEGHLPL
ncbi:hypothetical protein ACN3XK_71705 [Actinomadura welshii]